MYFFFVFNLWTYNNVIFYISIHVCLQYGEYEQVVVEDRVEKEKARRKVEQESDELRAAIKVSHGTLSVLDLTEIKVRVLDITRIIVRQ